MPVLEPLLFCLYQECWCTLYGIRVMKVWRIIHLYVEWGNDKVLGERLLFNRVGIFNKKCIGVDFV